jgi:hypothetical protein
LKITGFLREIDLDSLRNEDRLQHIMYYSGCLRTGFLSHE